MRRSALALVLLTILTTLAGAVPVTFTFDSPGASQVYVAGSFNDWSQSGDLMEKGEDGLFRLTLDIPAGKHLYKYIADGNWLVDPQATETVDDNHGGENGVFTVGDKALVLGGEAKADEAQTAKVKPVAKQTGGVETLFRFEPKTGGVRDIYLAGSFNDWDPARDRMQDTDGDGVYEIKLKITAGLHSYKYVVDGNWIAPDEADDFEDDGHGGQNAVIQIGAGDGGSGMFRVTFSHRASSARAVFLAGSFNDWNADKTAMKDDDKDGVWQLDLVLPAGEIMYKFVVDGNWTTDKEGADRFIDDGFGGQNSIIDVDGRFAAVKRERGDGEIDLDGLRFTPGFPDLNRVSDQTLEVTFRTAAGDVDGVKLRYTDYLSSVAGGPSLDMTLVAADGVNDIWRAEIRRLSQKTQEFLFLVEDGTSLKVFDTLGLHPVQGDPIRGPQAMGSPFTIDLENLPTFYTPDWVKDGIFYQIFPDRFCNGDTSNDPDFTEWYYEGRNKLPRGGKTNDEYFHMVDDWDNFGGLTHSPYRTDGRPDYFSFYGGDIAGVVQKLDYLVDLGVTIIYFNPITEGKSNHKYDATDYMTVDPHFASKDEFRAFVDKAHKKGIRVVVEAVFNHCGDTHWAFVDSRDKGRESEYWDWYEWKKWPLPEGGGYKAIDYYECWWGFGLHPNLNFDLSRGDGQESGVRDMAEAKVNQPLVDHLMTVTEFWLKDMDVDGFRMDVPNDVPFWFWNLFNEKVKSIKPDAYLLGELWGYAPEWIGPDMFDATMNYKYFRDPVTRWIGQGKGNATSFERAMAPGRTAYPSQAVQVMMNLIDSHDTIRFVNTAQGDRRRLMMAALLTMTYVGTPHIWYGDEIAMEGEKDPDCRRPFYWNYTDDPSRVEIRDYYKKLTHLRAEYMALRRGSLNVIKAAGDDYAFIREGDGERLLTVIHNGDRGSKIELEIPGGANTGWRFLVGGSDPGGNAKVREQGGKLIINLPPLSGAVLIADR